MHSDQAIKQREKLRERYYRIPFQLMPLIDTVEFCTIVIVQQHVAGLNVLLLACMQAASSSAILCPSTLHTLSA